MYNYRQDNFDASSYNKKGISYTAEEYCYTEQFLEGLSEGWKRVYYLKMAGLTTDRFHSMAVSGEFWTEAEKGIEKLSQKLSFAVKSEMITSEECADWHDFLWPELKLFLKNPNELYTYIKKDYDRRFSRLRKIYEIAIQHKIYIFGAGKIGQFVAMFLLMNGIENVIGFCDNNADLQGKYLGHFLVTSPYEAFKKQPDAFYIIAVKNFACEIKKQLIKIGLREDVIEVCSTETNIDLLRKISDRMH